MFRSRTNQRRVVRIRIGRALISVAAVLVLAAVAGLALPESVLAAEGGKGKGGGGQDERVPLCVTFDDDASDNILSDLMLDYCDGELDTVEPDSWIRAYSLGGFALDTASGPKENPSRRSNKNLVTGGRKILFLFTSPADGSSADTPFAEGVGAAEVLMFLVLKSFPDGVDLRTMMPGDSFPSDMVMMISPNEQAVDWRITFGRPPGGVAESTDFVWVTAGEDLYGNDGYADEWRIETLEMMDIGRLWKLTKTQSWSDQGVFYLPFGITAQLAP